MKSSGTVLATSLAVLTIVFLSPDLAAADQVTLTFQEGDGGAYSSTHGADIAYAALTGNGSGPTLTASIDFVIADFTPGKIAFLGFPDIFGDNPGQIPAGSTVLLATLKLTRVNSSTHTAALATVTSAWDENTITGQNYPGVSASPFVYIVAGDPGPYVIPITAVVAAWATGTPNWGLSISTGYFPTVFSESFASDDAPDLGTRPLLTVTFTPPTLNPVESTTWGKVKALYR